MTKPTVLVLVCALATACGTRAAAPVAETKSASPSAAAPAAASEATPPVASTAPPAPAASAAPPAPVASAAPPAPAASAAPANGASACITFDAKGPDSDGAPVTLEGKIFVDRSYAGGPFILKLAAPRCVLNAGATKSVDEVHLAPANGTLKPFVGKNVRVVDGVPFKAHTGHHARDVVVTTKNVVALP